VKVVLFVQGVVAYAVGETLVCETLAEAQDLCFTRNEKVGYPVACAVVVSSVPLGKVSFSSVPVEAIC
jgi:hypothetical protein